ncbi:MAG: cupin domain-containing protein [Bacillota bacterium]|nr:cupin domain-containing protein [Bacillota bacterium]
MDIKNTIKQGCISDYGSCPFISNISNAARQNSNFRTAFWTGNHLQMTLMCIPVCGEIGAEVHPETDQYIRVETGQAFVRMGTAKDRMCFKRQLNAGDAVFIPCGTWHNISNAGNCSLKLSSIYAPPHHPRGTVHRTRTDAEHEHY